MRICIIMVLAALALHAQEQPLVQMGPDGRLVYTPHANEGQTNANNVIPDFSHSGYMGGGVAIPDVPVRAVVEHQEGDATKRIQAAIDEVSKLPLDKQGFRGAVLIKAGLHDMSDGLGIRASGVVLRGEGEGVNGTRLDIDKPKMVRTFITIDGTASYVDAPGSATRIVDDYVGTGATSFKVADASAFAPGELVRVYITPNQTWLDDIMVNKYIGPNPWRVEEYTIPYLRRISSLAGNTITLDAPLVCPIQAKHGGGEVRKVAVANGGGIVSNIGLERLSILSYSQGHDKGRVVDAIKISRAENVWVRNIAVYDQADSMVTIGDARFVTVQDCMSLRPRGPKRGGYRYTFNVDKGASQNLFQRCFAYDGRHDFVAGAFVAGPNVFLDCHSMRGGTQGPHHRWATGLLFDNITTGYLAVSENRGASGSGHGWTGAGHVAWNCRAAICNNTPKGYQNYAIGCIGGIGKGGYVNNDKEGVYEGYFESHDTRVQPRSLYIQQLRDRLGEQAVLNVTTAEQRSGDFLAGPPEVRMDPPIPVIVGDSVTVVLDSPSPGARIHYTLDGSHPTPDSPRYAGPLVIKEPCEIKAVAMDERSLPGLLAQTNVVTALPADTTIKTADLTSGLVSTVYECHNRDQFFKVSYKDNPVLSRSVVADMGPHVEEFEEDIYAFTLTGYINIPESGAYTFNNTGVRYYQNVLIDDQSVAWAHGKYVPRKGTGTVGLQAGIHKIELQHFRWTGPPEYNLRWSGPGFEEEPIPSSVLFHRSEAGAVAMDYLPPPTIAPPRVIVPGKPAAIAISTEYAKGQIRYTLDGTEPTAESALYAAPLTIDKSCTIKAATFDGTRSGTSSALRVECPVSPRQTKPGLQCLYYSNAKQKGIPDFSGMTADQVIVVADASLPTDLKWTEKFLLRYRGFIDVPKDGLYTFETNDVEYYLDVYIAGKHLVHSGGKYAPRSGKGSVALLAGRHEIDLRYLGWGGKQSFNLVWSGPDFEKKPIPAEALSYEIQP